jgi:hypothetical protein
MGCRIGLVNTAGLGSITRREIQVSARLFFMSLPLAPIDNRLSKKEGTI